MKKVIKIFVMSTVISMLLSMMALAAPRNPNAHTAPTDTELMPVEQKYSMDTSLILERGMILSSCMVRITNEGYGKIGILAHTLCHTSIDRGYITIYLDKWSEDRQTWANMEKYEFEFLPEDEPTGELHAMSVDFDNTDQEPGYYYRLWSYHEVEKDGEWEGKKVRTDGILITDTP